jgi:hypothetical protein
MFDLCICITVFVDSQVMINNLRKLLTAGAAKDATLIMMVPTNRCQLLLSWFATPLTGPSTWSLIGRNGAIKFICLY